MRTDSPQRGLRWRTSPRTILFVVIFPWSPPKHRTYSRGLTARPALINLAFGYCRSSPMDFRVIDKYPSAEKESLHLDPLDYNTSNGRTFARGSVSASHIGSPCPPANFTDQRPLSRSIYPLGAEEFSTQALNQYFPLYCFCFSLPCSGVSPPRFAD